tara:strand:+ start:5331 stop:6413 length:1083 start_codon:yes stop_codon:yes gene_type:complete
MKLQYKTLLLIFLLPGIVIANHDKFNGKYTKEKTVKKEYNVNKNALLEIENSYGNVDIISWDENRTVIEVHIKTNSDDEEKAQRKLNDITIEFYGSSSRVSAKTIFKNNKSSWSFWGENNSVNMEINYTIKIPVTNSVNLENNYGAISLDKLEGNAKISCDYGQLRVGELWAEDNTLNFDYTNKSTIAFMKGGKIDANYSGFTLEKGGKLALNADYTQSVVQDIEDINYNSDYGKVVIDKAVKVVGVGDYVTHRIGTITGSLNLDADYGSIKVDRLEGSAKNVTIEADYTGVKLGFTSDYSFNFDINLSYSSLKGEENVTVTKSHKDNSRRTYEGYHGNNTSGNMVRINSDYGGVTFFEN